MIYKSAFFHSLLCFLVFSCKSDDYVIALDALKNGDDTNNKVGGLDTSFLIDENLKLVLYNGNDVVFEKKLGLGADTLILDTAENSLTIGKMYSGTFQGETYTLYRTQLPMIAINTKDQNIGYTKKIPAQLHILEKGKTPVRHNMGIELRGAISASFPKQSFAMELWEKNTGETTFDAELLDMRNDDDWILDGLWNEPLHLRDFIAHDLWLKIGRYPYQNIENITLGIDRKFCEVFVNGSYRGVYYLGERIDRKQLKLVEFDGQVRGELFKGDHWGPGTLFEGVEEFSNNDEKWSGYEIKYPDALGEFDWANLHHLVDFVVNSDQTTFNAQIANRLFMPNMVDYFIFMNTVYAEDNYGKNMYTARYDQASPFFFIPWDMDASFGNNAEGNRHYSTNYILSNGLFERLIENPDFKQLTKARWQELRASTLTANQIRALFQDSYDLLDGNLVYDREALNPELPISRSLPAGTTTKEEELAFILNWIPDRLEYLDAFFNDF